MGSNANRDGLLFNTGHHCVAQEEESVHIFMTLFVSQLKSLWYLDDQARAEINFRAPHETIFMGLENLGEGTKLVAKSAQTLIVQYKDWP